MNSLVMKQQLKAWAGAHAEEYLKIADDIWKHPELSMQEFHCSGLIKDKLRAEGFTVEEGTGGMPTAFLATYSYGTGKPVIGINCEYDSLPGLSQSCCSTSKNPITEGAPGQGCGHNLLGTAALKTAVALRYLLEEETISGTIKVIGAPAEEMCVGKPFLGKAGALKGMDVILDWHPWSSNRADYDSCLAYFNVKFHFKGKTSHGNSPWHGRSALDAAMIMGTASEYLREHTYPGNPPDGANTFNYTFSDTGPEFASVVPDRASIWYVGRYETVADAKEGLRRITNCAKGAAMATETEVRSELITFTNHKLRNKTLAEVMHKNFQEIGPPDFTEEEQRQAKEIQKNFGISETGLATDIQPFGGGYSIVCDTSEYSWNAPYAVAWITLAPENIGWHNWGVAYCANNSMGVKCMDKAVELLTCTAVDLLSDPQLIQKAKEEFKERKGGQDYECQLPDDLCPPLELNKETMGKYPVEK